MNYVFTEEAKSEFYSIAAYIARDNPQAALRVQEAILDTCDLIASMPDIGHHPDYVDDIDVLCFQVSKFEDYFVFYTKSSIGVTILNILHGARNLPNLLNS